MATNDGVAIGAIEKLLESYTEQQAVDVFEWAQENWPPGSEYRYCVTISHLLGSKFGDHITKAAQRKEEKAPNVFHPGEEFMLKHEDPPK